MTSAGTNYESIYALYSENVEKVTAQQLNESKELEKQLDEKPAEVKSTSHYMTGQ